MGTTYASAAIRLPLIFILDTITEEASQYQVQFSSPHIWRLLLSVTCCHTLGLIVCFMDYHYALQLCFPEDMDTFLHA